MTRVKQSSWLCEDENELQELEGLTDVYEIDDVFHTYDGERLIPLPIDKQQKLRIIKLRQMAEESSKAAREEAGMSEEQAREWLRGLQTKDDEHKINPEELKDTGAALFKRQSDARNAQEKLRAHYETTMVKKSSNPDALSQALLDGISGFITNQTDDTVVYDRDWTYEEPDFENRLYGDPSQSGIILPGETIVRNIEENEARPLVLIYLDQSGSFVGDKHKRKIKLEQALVNEFKSTDKYDVKYFIFNYGVKEIESPDDLEHGPGGGTSLNAVINSIKDESKGKLVNVVIVTDDDANGATNSIQVTGSVWLIYAEKFSSKLFELFGGKDPETAKRCTIKQFFFQNID